MNEFMMIFRMEPMGDFIPSPEQMQESIKQWQDWMGGIAAQGNFVSTNRLGKVGKTLKPGGIVTDGPYAELKEIVGGYLVVKANSFNDAVELAEGCPIFQVGGHVEVRDLIAMN